MTRRGPDCKKSLRPLYEWMPATHQACPSISLCMSGQIISKLKVLVWLAELNETGKTRIPNYRPCSISVRPNGGSIDLESLVSLGHFVHCLCIMCNQTDLTVPVNVVNQIFWLKTSRWRPRHRHRLCGVKRMQTRPGIIQKATSISAAEYTVNKNFYGKKHMKPDR